MKYDAPYRRPIVSLTCPSCKRPNALSRREALKGYQCLDCTRRDEGCGY